ncbi:MAG: GUN4 domain-containing protein [Cyanobacteria bacterium P01_F01_bin.150]
MAQTPTPKSPLDERITDALIKLIVTGGGGYALYNLYTDDIPKAAIAALVSAGAGFANRSWQALLKPIGEWWNSRLDRTGQTLKQQVTTLDQRASGVANRYLEALRGYCQDLEIEGYKGYLSALPLKAVYVPLKINADVGQALKFEAPKTIWEFLPAASETAADTASQPQKLVIIANPGFGKTTLTRYLTLSFADETYRKKGVKQLFPVLLLLRSLPSQIQDEHTPALGDLMVQQIQKLPRCQNLPPFDQWLQTKLQQGELLVMFDGLDEVPKDQRETVSRWINWQTNAYASHFILTSRPHGYDPTLFSGIRQVKIIPFTDQDKRDFIEQWYRTTLWIHKWQSLYTESQRKPAAEQLSFEQAQAQSDAEAQQKTDDLKRQLFKNADLTALAENPLLVTIIASTHQAFDTLPQYRKDLYKQIFDLLLQYRYNRRPIKLTIRTAADNQKILQTLALEMLKAGKTEFTPEEGAKWIKQELWQVWADDGLTPQQYLCEIQQVSGLLAGGEGNLYQFTHKTFQEYLAAAALKEKRLGNLVTGHFDDPNWEETVCFYAALTDPIPFIDFALRNPSQYTLSLAQRLKEESTRVSEAKYAELLAARQQLQPESSSVTLEQQFNQMMELSDTAEITPEPITVGEYALFLSDQQEKRFHSWADDQPLNQTEQSRAIVDIAWEDARWFCAWLSTQPHLAPDDGVYHYRLPTPEEWTSFSRITVSPASYQAITMQPPSSMSVDPWTTDPNLAGNVLRVVRERISDRYANLVNYLASGSWKEADQETYKLMLLIAGKDAKKRQYLQLDEIKNLPCEDLLIIDQLWVKFSGGKFGFSVQKKLWVKVGGKLDFLEDYGSAQEAFEKMSNRNGWSKAGYSTRRVTYDSSAPDSHLPWTFCRRVEDFLFFDFLFSRIASCEL